MHPLSLRVTLRPIWKVDAAAMKIQALQRGNKTRDASPLSPRSQKRHNAASQIEVSPLLSLPRSTPAITLTLTLTLP